MRTTTLSLRNGMSIALNPPLTPTPNLNHITNPNPNPRGYQNGLEEEGAILRCVFASFFKCEHLPEMVILTPISTFTP